jgi:aryl-alcohol dehydrogenase-like predicted oxidoreductase
MADAMEKLRDRGMTRFLGLTSLDNNKATIAVIKSGRFDSAQVYYNLINPSSAWDRVVSGWSGYDGSGIMAACCEQDMAVMAIRIFAASYLATPERNGRESILTANTEAEAEIRNAEAVFAKLGVEHSTRAQMAVRFALSNKIVSTAIVGLSESAHLDEAAAGADTGPLSDDAMAKLEQLYNTGFE